MPGGRPTVYDPKYCDMLIEHMAQGFSFESFAGKIGVCFKTLYTWKDQHPEFLQAQSNGKARSLTWWEDQGRLAMWTDEKGSKFNNTIWIFSMKNKFGWRDRVETTVKDPKDLLGKKYKDVADEDLESQTEGSSSDSLD